MKFLLLSILLILAGCHPNSCHKHEKVKSGFLYGAQVQVIKGFYLNSTGYLEVPSYGYRSIEGDFCYAPEFVVPLTDAKGDYIGRIHLFQDELKLVPEAKQ